MKISFAILLLALAAIGCQSKTNARLREQNAYLAGQNAILQQHQAQIEADSPGVTVVGAVQHPHVPWVTGLTLAQAIATASYVGQDQPKQIILTHNGETAALDPSVLLNGKDVPVEIGDTIELR